MVGQDEPDTGRAKKARTISLFGRKFTLPRSRLLRVLIGGLLVVFGFLGFLPVLGFWMVPLGLLVLSYEFAFVRRIRRKIVIRFARRQKSG